MGFERADFDRLFRASDDPWQFRSSPYERRKREMTLAALPQQRYASAYEPGCANGELSAALAERCDALLATDGSARAVGLATARLAALPHVRVRQAWLPAEWPRQRFDLVVLSELGYFLDAAGLQALMRQALVSLSPGGTLLACHWRHPIEHGSLDGDAVHARLKRQPGLQPCGAWLETDFRIDVLRRVADADVAAEVAPPDDSDDRLRNDRLANAPSGPPCAPHGC